MIIILLLLYFFHRFNASSASVTTRDLLSLESLTLPGDEPSDSCSGSGRSVYDILWNCLATTFTVTWVSVHPNVPFLEESNWAILRRRVFLMILALLAPEVMIMWAFKQWRGAMMIKDLVNEARPESCQPWTLKHAHFLQMGGFKLMCSEGEAYLVQWYGRVWRALERGSAHRSQYEDDMWEGVMNFKRFISLLQNHNIDFPATTEAEIDDRSKGDALSKGVALLQVTWFIIQLIARACQGLTITEIELTTAALAGLNSIMYLFWWYKPLDVHCPIIIRTKEVERRLAERPIKEYDYRTPTQQNGDPIFQLRDHLLRKYRALRSASQMITYVHSSFGGPIQWTCVVIYWIADTLTKPFRWIRTIYSTIRQLFARQTNIQAAGQANSEIVLSIKDTGSYTYLPECTQPEGDSDSVKTCFSRVFLWSTIRKLFLLPYLLMFMPMRQILRPWTFKQVQYKVFKDAKERIHNKSKLELLLNEDDLEWVMSMIFYCEEANTKPFLYFSTISGAVFGSIHCAAWNVSFPSHVEKLIWRTASLTLVGICVCIPIVGTTSLYDYLRSKEWVSDLYGTDHPRFGRHVKAKKILETVPAIIYSVARLTLLILAVLSLRDLPKSARRTVTWAMYVPHI